MDRGGKRVTISSPESVLKVTNGNVEGLRYFSPAAGFLHNQRVNPLFSLPGLRVCFYNSSLKIWSSKESVGPGSYRVPLFRRLVLRQHHFVIPVSQDVN